MAGSPHGKAVERGGFGVDTVDRRAQGPQAGVRAARAACVGGCAGTSNVLAGYLYGVPVTGTAAHRATIGGDARVGPYVVLEPGASVPAGASVPPLRRVGADGPIG